MTGRQRKITAYLYDQQNYVAIQSVADFIGCSEKTVRTELKVIHEYIETHQWGDLVRRPSRGIRFNPSEEKQAQIKEQLFSIEEKNQPSSRKDQTSLLLRLLLDTKKEWTIKQLSEELYESQVVIKELLKESSERLQKYRLSIQLKPNVGVSVIGPETGRRAAMADLVRESLQENHPVKEWFSPFDWEAVNKMIKGLEQQSSFFYTRASRETLLIHILLAVKRIMWKRCVVYPAESIDMERIEMKKAAQLVKELEAYFQMTWPSAEVYYLSIHLRSARLELPSAEGANVFEQLQIDPETIRFAHHLIETVTAVTGHPYDKDSDLFRDTAAHLHSSTARIDHHFSHHNPMASEIRKMYPYLFEMIIEALAALEPAKEWPLEEVAYLTIHFQVSLERSKKTSADYMRVLIVCPMGIGMSRLLQTKLERKFHSLQTVGCQAMNEAEQFDEDRIDIIVSTVPLQRTDVPVVVVSPFLREEEQQQIHRMVNTLKENGQNVLQELISSPAHIHFLQESNHIKAITHLAGFLEKTGKVTPAFVESAINREKKSSTFIGGGIAIPHGDPAFIQIPSVAVGIFSDPIDWNGSSAAIVLLLAADLQEGRKVKTLFEEISKLSDSPDRVARIRSLADAEAVFTLF